MNILKEIVGSTKGFKKFDAPGHLEDGVLVDEIPEEEHDMVNHPPHYNAGNIEVIDFIEDQEHLGYHLLQAIRYITRSPFKGTAKQDLEKAMWYLNRHIAKMVKVKHD